MDLTPDELFQQSARQMRYLKLRLLRLQQINDQLLAGLRELETLAQDRLGPGGELPTSGRDG